MKFQIQSQKLINDYWFQSPPFQEVIEMYPFLKNKTTLMCIDEKETIGVIEINSFEELNDLVKSVEGEIVYQLYNEPNKYGLNGIITIYDSYIEN